MRKTEFFSVKTQCFIINLSSFTISKSTQSEIIKFLWNNFIFGVFLPSSIPIFVSFADMKWNSYSHIKKSLSLYLFFFFQACYLLFNRHFFFFFAYKHLVFIHKQLLLPPFQSKCWSGAMLLNSSVQTRTNIFNTCSQAFLVQKKKNNFF